MDDAAISDDGGIKVRWEPPGPIAQAFMQSDARVQAIMGPLGSGKTRTVFVKALLLAAAQPPSPIDRRRYFKLCVVRDTYRRLWDTTIPSWFKVIPQETASWSGGFGDPAHCKITMKLPDDSEIEMHLDFIAIGDQAIEDAMRGYEPTGFYLNEADLLEEDVFTYARSRVGRYPDMAHGGPRWYGLILDFNAPDTENWIYNRIVTQADGKDIAFFRQPSALSPLAENIQNLPPRYYDELSINQPQWWLRRFVLNEFGFSRHGKPIYPEWVDSQHVAPTPLVAVRALPLVIGLDAGLTPAAVICQHMPNGQWRVYEELESEMGTGAMRFGERLAQVLRDHYPDWRTINVWADPSATTGDRDGGRGDEIWTEIVTAKTGVSVWPAPTNDLVPRWEAVRRPLTRWIDGEPGFKLSPSCGRLRAGFNAEYRFKRLQVRGVRYEDRAEKNAASHVHDALQYALSGGGEDAEIGDRKNYAMSPDQLPRESLKWDPFNY